MLPANMDRTVTSKLSCNLQNAFKQNEISEKDMYVDYPYIITSRLLVNYRFLYNMVVTK